ncbi:MAG: LemA family protein [Bdellovibrionota bacterium]|nr:MAG: LemA family protein [Bdellovibrionota bacterium]
MTLLILLAVVGGLLFIAVGIYNGLVSKRIQSENAWSQISVQLKRRHDLIPNLVETVKGYVTHERETLERVIQARNSAVTATNQGDVRELGAAEAGLTGALHRLFALAEAYPDLKANQNFSQLHEELTSTENRIAFARQHYNDAVASYNTALQQVPGNLIAGVCGFKAKEFFEMDELEAQVASKPPQVSF